MPREVDYESRGGKNKKRILLRKSRMQNHPKAAKTAKMGT
jgi:hypothetical protein